MKIVIDIPTEDYIMMKLAYESGMGNSAMKRILQGTLIEQYTNAPLVIPQTNTAEWIDDDDHLSENTECSICNFYMLKEFKKRCKYCPNCGAKMVESEEVG